MSLNPRDRFLKRQETFEKWLVERGAEVLAPTNEWEVLRFRTGRGVSIVYRKANGTLTFTGESKAAYDGYGNPNGPNSGWRGTERTGRKAKSSPTCATLRQRDGDTCFYCHQVVAVEDESVEHLVALTAGGPDHLANMALACRPCNLEAGHLSLMDKLRLREKYMVRGLLLPASGPKTEITAYAAPAPVVVTDAVTEPPWETT